MTIDPEIVSKPFASIEAYSQFPSENEILFSTHTVFRIDRVTVADDGGYYVNLSLTDNHDQALCELMSHRREEIQGRTSLHRLAHLLYRMAKYENARHIYQVLLGIVRHDEILFINHYLARIDCQLGQYGQALSKQATSLKFDNCRDASLTAAVYAGMGEALLRHDTLEESLEFYEKALQIAMKSKVVNDHDKVLYFNNVGLVHKLKNRHNEAKYHFEQALEIARTRFPPTHPDLGSLYDNMGSLYFQSGEFETCIDYQKKSLEIQLLSLPPDHPSLGHIHHNLSKTFNALHQSDQAIHHAQLACTILKKTLGDDHPDVRAAQSHLDTVSIIQRRIRSTNTFQHFTTHY
jgi:tetratricopeptide (TPR) repeat protein